MTATEMLVKKLPYIQYNYDRTDPIRIAAEKRDIAEFRRAAAHVTELMDAGVVAIVDARD